MKPKTKEDKYDSERLERFDGPIPDACKKQIREAKRRVKRQVAKNRRNAGKREVLNLQEDE